MSCRIEAACRASCSSGRETEFAGDFPRVNLHARQVIVRGVVLGFDRQRQRFDGAQMQSPTPLPRVFAHFPAVPIYSR